MQLLMVRMETIRLVLFATSSCCLGQELGEDRRGCLARCTRKGTARNDEDADCSSDRSRLQRWRSRRCLTSSGACGARSHTPHVSHPACSLKFTSIALSACESRRRRRRRRRPIRKIHGNLSADNQFSSARISILEYSLRYISILEYFIITQV